MSFENILYAVSLDDREAFGSNWCGPEEFVIWTEVLVAKYPKVEGGDGNPVEIYCTAAPARFYRISILASFNSVGEPKPGFEVFTGAGTGISKTAAKIAEDCSQGMLSFRELK
jgi:hypothetical protein